MTLPSESRDALRWTKNFLYTLLSPQQTPGVPKKVRAVACACLRHYPMNFEIDELFVKEEREREPWSILQNIKKGPRKTCLRSSRKVD